jgi:hypothetical protein
MLQSDLTGGHSLPTFRTAKHEPETIDMSDAVPDAKSRRSLGMKEN